MTTGKIWFQTAYEYSHMQLQTKGYMHMCLLIKEMEWVWKKILKFAYRNFHGS